MQVVLVVCSVKEIIKHFSYYTTLGSLTPCSYLFSFNSMPCSFCSLHKEDVDLHHLFYLSVCLSEIHKNVISPLNGEEKMSSLHEKHVDLKQRMRDLNQGFERLRKITHEGFDTNSGAFLFLYYFV